MSYIRALKDMVEGDSEHFSVQMGFHKRLVLDLFLFVLVMNKVTKCI